MAQVRTLWCRSGFIKIIWALRCGLLMRYGTVWPLMRLRPSRAGRARGLWQPQSGQTSAGRHAGGQGTHHSQVQGPQFDSVMYSVEQCCGSESGSTFHMFFGPPGSGSVSISQRYGSGSGSFYQHAKIVRKTLIPTALWLLFDFLSFWKWC